MPRSDGTVRARNIHETAAAFIREHPAVSFFPGNDREPDTVPQRHIAR
jgi:hypothetical protein